MPLEPGRWIQWLFRLSRFRASEAELGDIQEEYASGHRSAFWLLRQILSAIRKPQPHVVFNEARIEMLSNFWSDLRYTLRTFRRNPGFAVAALVPIALGIGINTGVFSILNNVAFRSLPVPNPSELVNVYQEFQGVKKRRVHGARIMFSMPEYREYRDATRTLSGLARTRCPGRFRSAASLLENSKECWSPATSSTSWSCGRLSGSTLPTPTAIRPARRPLSC